MLTRLFKVAKKQVPRISRTEMEALKAGSVGIEGKIFSGNLTNSYIRSLYPNINPPTLPSLDKIVNTYSATKLEKVKVYMKII